ncbi:hypothetical protein PG994_002755 [Apiospora phragmitis]|uniref:Uncharacterized protein n=1 Tax=Apiospora phragmitis TaxID=2905665 RepID=A0ABR1W9V7_9PEZI
MAQTAFPSNVPITQIFYVNISPLHDLGNGSLESGRIWTKLLDIIAGSPGFVRLYWGRRLSGTGRGATSYRALLCPDPPVSIRHMALTHQVLANPFSKSLLGYPIGTAIYKSCNAAWHEGAWPLWTHVVRYVSGCLGIAGRQVLEPVEGMAGSYCVYVGWQTAKHHDDYHHTDHFRKHSVILRIGHES